MAALKPSDDPYRILGVLRGADPDQIKAAHRRLAKRFHPDGGAGDEQRFLVVQEAYQLLSDPRRRREWDRHHSSAPSRAADPGARASRRAARSTPPSAGATTPSQRTTAGAARPARAPGQRTTRGPRTTTWSADHVPWWEEFRPRTRRQNDERAAPPAEPSAAASAAQPPQDAPTDGKDGDLPPEPTIDFDVFSRSSGAAWSMAARRHFRRGDAELPSRGAWRYRGTQVVTGAEARKVAAEEASAPAAEQAREAGQAREEEDR